jgi:hypothetical protein
MSYKIEVPVPNNVHFSEATLADYIDLIEDNKEHIDSLYFPLGYVDEDTNLWGIRAPSYVYPDGKLCDKRAVMNWENALAHILEFVNVPVKILMNNIYSPAFHNSEQWTKISKKLQFYRCRYEVKSVTVTDTTAMDKLIRQGFPISLSTNSHTSLQELDMLMLMEDFQYVQSITLQRDLNRNPKRLEQYIRKHPELENKIVLMVNEGCVNACVYKNSGDVEISLSDLYTGSNKIHVQGCMMIAQRQPWLFLTSQFLTKQIIDEHYPWASVIKLAGRNLPVSRIRSMLDHYIHGKDEALRELLNVSPTNDLKVSNLSTEYWSDVLTCNKECASCLKCKSHLEKLQRS